MCFLQTTLHVLQWGNMDKRIYLDHAASTPTLKEVLNTMEPYWSKDFANPGGLHREGVLAKAAVEATRAEVALLLGAKPQEIIFTSGGTEGNSLAVLGFVEKLVEEGTQLKDMHFISTKIEHPSVLHIFEKLLRRGAMVTFLGVSDEGIVDPQSVREALQYETVLVSVMYANNEIGTIQPIREIGRMVKEYRGEGALPRLHVDASQVPSYLDVTVEKLGVDLLVLDGQKIYGPKGVGVLYIKKGVALAPLFWGGRQERGLRPGTENVPLIVGFGVALKIALRGRETETKRLEKLRDDFISLVLKTIPKMTLNGHRSMRLANNINFTLSGMDGEWVVSLLDAKGIAVGTRSSCFSPKDGEGSYVIRAIGGDKDASRRSVRITLGRETTWEDLEYTATALADIVRGQNRH